MAHPISLLIRGAMRVLGWTDYLPLPTVVHRRLDAAFWWLEEKRRTRWPDEQDRVLDEALARGWPS